ncbi:MAG: hypothetical protein H6704_21980 [Myxococcales bacterium]|nr:hypothetical protein [Myxococcales bacterium]MCB9538912.1 hypothetical protein [Myxococcales bacterium]
MKLFSLSSAAWALVAGLALAAPARAGDFVDTRLVFIAGDDDFQHDAGITVPPSQRPDIGDRAGYTEFYDARDESETGRESRTHLVLHKAAEGYFPGLLTEAALVLELDHSRLLTGDPRSLSDDGTYLRIEKAWGEGRLEVLMMPFDSDRMRLGWYWDNTWGGNHVFPTATLVPGLQLAWRHTWYGVHVGAKTARQTFVTRDLDERNGQIEAFYGVFGGVEGGKAEGGLRGQVQGGFFEKGRNPNGPVRGKRVDAAGVSARISYVDGLPFGPTTDTRLYSADPLTPWNVFEPAAELRWRAAAEVTYLTQVLEDPDTTGGTEAEPGLALAIYGRGELGNGRLRAFFLHRDLGFLFFNQPGVLRRFQALPDDVDTTPEMVFGLGYEHHLPGLHLTPGVTVGLQQPAAVSNQVPNAGIHQPDILSGRRTAVYRRADMFDDTGLLTGYFLPDDAEVLPVYGARFHLQLDLAVGFALLAEVTLLHDENRVLLEQDALQVNSVRTFDDPLTVGGAFMARAEF